MRAFVLLPLFIIGVMGLAVVEAQQTPPDGSQGYWAGNRGEALDLAVKAAAKAPKVPAGPFKNPDPDWGKEPVEELTACRGRVELRGGWNIVKGDQGAWEMLRLRNWAKEGGPLEVRRTHPWRLPGGGAKWYGRTVAIPAAWQGRAILLQFEVINRTGLVFVDGRACGQVNLAGEVDITAAVTPGRNADVTVYMLDQGAQKDWNGLVGPVRLISRPRGAVITDVYVMPSVRKQEITLDVEVSWLDKAGPLAFTAEFTGPAGQVEKTFTARADADAARTQVLRLTWPWKDPVLWDLGKPNLYTLRLAVKGEGIDDIYHQPFGFREFWIDGRKIFLNGREVFLRTGQANWLGWQGGRQNLEGMEGAEGFDLRAHLDAFQRNGFDFIHQTPSGAWPSSQLDVAKLASQRGILMAGQIPADRNLKLDDPAARKRFVESVAFVQRQLRNQPSVVAWVSTGIPSMPGNDQNPWQIGQPKTLAGPEPPLLKVQREIDPAGRPVYWHAFTHGDITSINWYLCFTPLQEREEWISHWLEAGTHPVHGSEFGMPFNYTLGRLRTHAHNSGNPIMHEPFVVEHAASLLGPEFYYGLTQADWRFACWGWNDTDREPPVARRKSFLGVGMLIHNGWMEANLPAAKQFLEPWPRATWRSWRTMGFNLMPNVWWSELYQIGWPPSTGGSARPRPADRLEPKHRSLVEANQPTLAWICGPNQPKIADLTAKDHNFWGGAAMPAKNIAVVNDTSDTLPYSFAWTVEVGGKTVASGRATGQVKPGERRFDPIATSLPAVTEKTDGVIRIEGSIGQVKHSDRFAFRVFPQPQPVRGTVLAWDPVGKTTQMLKALGYTVTAWDGKPTDQLVVVGREALRQQQTPPGDLVALVQGGGRVLVMPHHPDWVQDQLGLRVSKFMSRKVFRTNNAHPVVAGLDDEDLRDWGGASTLVEAQPKEYRERADYGMPAYGWHWGNRGGISSGAPEAPHHAGWRSILVSEFDLAYAPLMEVDLGRGRVVWCSVDLEDYVPREPAAVTLARQLLAYTATAPLTPRVPTVTIGLDRQQTTLLARMGLLAETATQLPKPPALAVIGGRATVADAELRAFVQAGGTVFFLPLFPGAPALGATLTEVKEEEPNKLWPHLYPETYGLPKGQPGWTDIAKLEGKDVPVPDWPELAGLSVADFHRRGLLDYHALTGGCEPAMLGWVGRQKIGAGRAIYCQIDPESLPIADRPYLRLTRWRQTRVLAVMLANAGAQFTLDKALLLRDKPSAIDGGKVKGWYHPDYRNDHNFGDNPFRYWRW